VTRAALVASVVRYYETKLAAHGATAAGVDWNSEATQTLRFAQFAPLFDDPQASVVDYGCGYGALLDHLRRQGHAGAYVGFDASTAMTDAASARHANDPCADFFADRARVPPSDFAVASGVFNVKLDATPEVWTEYVLATISDLAVLGTRGFGFNALTSYSDRDRQRADLYYADPRMLFDYCKRTCSRRVALLHDYELYEFTILVRF
jgi:SAM-dependent methyltransferase